MFSFNLDTINTMAEDKSKCMALTAENLLLLTEMFCLPYEHGENGNKLLGEFEWLLENVADIFEQPPSKEKVRFANFLVTAFQLQHPLLLHITSITYIGTLALIVLHSFTF